MDLYLGLAIDKIGKKLSLAIGILIFALSATGFALTDSIYLLFLFNIIAYLGFDILFISIEGFLIETNEKRELNYASSGFFSLWQLGFTVGPIIAAFLLMECGYSSPYYLAVPLCGLALILFNFLFREANTTGKNTKYDLKYFKQLFKEEYIALWGIFICAFWNSNMVIGIPLLYAIEDGNIWRGALLAVAFSAPCIFTNLINGFIANSRSKRFLIIVLGFLIGGISLIFFSFCKILILEIIFAFLTTISVTSAWNTIEIEAGLVSERNNEGKTEGCFVFAKNIGWDVSPIFFGIIAQAIGIRTPFLATGIFLIISSLLTVKYQSQIK